MLGYPDIYLETAQRYPGRIPAIYIRDLAGKRVTAEHKCSLTAAASELGVDMLWMEHASVALRHARERGLVRDWDIERFELSGLGGSTCRPLRSNTRDFQDRRGRD